MLRVRLTGAVYGLAAATLFGASTPLAKALVGQINSVARQALGRNTSETPLRQRDIPWLASAIFSGGVIGPVLLMIGLVSTAALLLNLEGVAIMVIAWTVFRENFDRRIFLGALDDA